MTHSDALDGERQNNRDWQFWIDRGGTFTDIVAQRPDGATRVHKLLSENPERYEDAPIQGIRELMGLGDSEPIPAEQIAVVKMGTTVATNALLERQGDRTLFITTQGFKDGLRIGYQNRPDIFARQIVLAEMLYEQVIEVDERMAADGAVIEALTAEKQQEIAIALQQAYKSGIRSCAIAFIHGYRYPHHEQQIAALAKQTGFTQISASHQVSPLIKWVSRGDTTVVDAYLSPILRRYIDRIEKSLTPATTQTTQQSGPQILFMQSNGGLTPAKFFQGKDSILSGPAGGVVGAVQTSLAAGFDKIITFDMGGTSTDVAHFSNDSSSTSAVYERVFETEVAGVRMRSPMMAIHTVAAGGGSVLSFDGSRYRVGPASAGAYPGPACYRNDGPLTVTDCNVMVGKIQPQFFPKVFGSKGDQPLDRNIVEEKFAALAEEISIATGKQNLLEQVAEGFLSITIDNMANAIKKISVQKGHDIGDYALCCFGAAGGQHACKLAEALGMKTILIHPYAGVLSAYGMGLADRRILKEKSVEISLEGAIASLSHQLNLLEDEARMALAKQGDRDVDSIEVIRQCHLRYAGTDSTLTVAFATVAEMRQQFEQQYQQQYGVTLSDKELVVATVAVEIIGKTERKLDNQTDSKTNIKANIKANSKADKLKAMRAAFEPEPTTTVRLFSNSQWHDTPLFQRQDLQVGQTLFGPAILLEKTGTNIVEPGWQVVVSDRKNLILTQCDHPFKSNIEQTVPEGQTAKPDPVRLEIFNNLFQAIAEQMGFTLQNTSASVNIKERLDFSCAIFDVAGQLVANAPHIPVHLGSMGESVKALIADQNQPFQPGDVFISNNPYNGGTHLPDITAITPVFIESQPLFFVASRGHHADIGGVTPGSMPPNSTSVLQEGVLLDNFHLVERGVLKAKELRDRLTQSPYPARNLAQNLTDLQAQIAANNKGAKELYKMVKQFGLSTVQAYMQHVQDNAAQSVRQVIQQLYAQQGPGPHQCQVPMDCGATIRVSVVLNAADNSASIDFSRTSTQQPNNFNAPLAVCKAAVLYVFRTLVDQPIPLNAGCLKPLSIQVPAGSMLNPTYPAAVVAGNVETSQAVTDALYGALNILAAAQGTMNNFTFGNEKYQYYETICGGSGAGATFDGTDAVQTHMTNSRLTDPEILELRFPVLLKEFSIRENSGGAGKHSGGNGVIRKILFREAMTANLLAGRRTNPPFGLMGGSSAQSGSALVRRADGKQDWLSATATVDIKAGDEIWIATPGGGGYGV